MSDNIQEVEEVLDNPLVVHKKSDASYKDGVTHIELNETHDEDDGPTLQRHRFKKDINRQKKKKSLLTIPVLLVFATAVFCALYFTGIIQFGNKETTTVANETVIEETTSIEQAFEGTIVIKNTFIFVDGYEVDGITGLQDALKYVDPSETAYKIILENENADFYNFDVLETLTKLGFYGTKTEVEHTQRTGLVAYSETTTIPVVEESQPVTDENIQ